MQLSFHITTAHNRAMENPIAKVAKILEQTSVVINKGSKDGVSIGQTFVIYQPGEEIFDPDSGASLGLLEHVKGRATVAHVQESMSILKLEPKTPERTKTLSEVMATISGMDEVEVAENLEVGDWARLEEN